MIIRLVALHVPFGGMRTSLLGALCLTLTGLLSPVTARAALRLRPVMPVVTVGARLSLSAESSEGGNPPAPVAAAWSLQSETGAATVSPDGVITGLSVGTAIVTATWNGDSASAQVTVVPTSQAVYLSASDVHCVAGQSCQLPFILSSGSGATALSATLTLTSTDPNAPTLVPTSLLPAVGFTITNSGRIGNSYAFSLHITTPSRGPLAIGTVMTTPFASISHDTNYTAQLTGFTLTPAPTGRELIAQAGQITVHTVQPGPLTQLVVAPPQFTLYSSQVNRFFAYATDANGNAVRNASISWASDAPGIVSVDTNSGIVNALATGSAAITASAGGLNATAQVTVLPGTPPLPELLLTPTVTAPPNSEIVMPVLLATAPRDFGGATFMLRLTPPVGAPPLTFLGLETGPLAPGSLISFNPQDDGRIAVAMLATRPLQGPGVLMYLRYQIPSGAPSGGRYSLALEEVNISDSRAQKVEGVAWPGAILIDSASPVALITLPAANATVSGIVTLTGSASDTNFLNYRLRVASAATPNQLTEIGSPVTQPVVNGTLGAWDTTALPNGAYILHLVAEDASHNVTDSAVAVTVANLKKGDVNGDNVINVQDGILVLMHIIKVQLLTLEEAGRADATGDNQINIADVVKILRLAVGLP